MTCNDLNFKPIEYNGTTVYVARHTFTNGFTVSVITEEDNEGIFNAAIIKNDTMVVTKIHSKTKNFIVCNDYTFDLTDKRKVTFFLKNVDNLYPGDDFADVAIDENSRVIIGKKYPASKELLKIIKKITPFNDEPVDDNKNINAF